MYYVNQLLPEKEIHSPLPQLPLTYIPRYTYSRGPGNVVEFLARLREADQ
jgi:hypothetical protein